MCMHVFALAGFETTDRFAVMGYYKLRRLSCCAKVGLCKVLLCKMKQTYLSIVACLRTREAHANAGHFY